jgi:hypothetical protein
MSSTHLAAAATPRPAWLATARRTGWLGLGLAALAFGGLEVANHGPWALALLIALLVAPDLTFFMGLKQARQTEPGQLPPGAVPWYNAAHRAWVPVLLLAVYTVSPLTWAPLFAAGLGWLAHIALDRSMGYGLRSAAGFQRHGAAGTGSGPAHR